MHNPLEQLTGRRIARDESCQRVLTPVKSQVSFPGFRVGTVTLKTLVRQDRTNVAAEVDLVRKQVSTEKRAENGDGKSGLSHELIFVERCVRRLLARTGRKLARR